MGIKIEKNYNGIIKEFNNKKELFEFVQREIQNRSFENNQQEKLKIKILQGKSKYFTIYDLIKMIDYKRIHK